MNSEENRLQTFTDWPSNAPVSPVRIAKAGFYSVKEGLTVECFACQIRITEWNYGDQVMAKHKNANPSCSFVLDPSTSGNVPIITQPVATQSTSSLNLNYKDETVRLSSFRNWPIPHVITPESLASAGFYYYDVGDNTKCAFCNGVMTSWLPEDVPDKEHKRHFPNCPFVISTISSRLLEQLQRDNTLTNVDLVSHENSDALGVNAHKTPGKPSCATLEVRLKTFSTWPSELIQTPQELAQAGFYYEGIGDQVRCFHCEGGLRHWDPEDDPWTEHARWFPSCSYVTIVKGHDFIQLCSKAHTDNRTGKLTNLQLKNVRKFHVTEAELEQHMGSNVVSTALNIGLSVDRVKRALKEKLEQTGSPYSHADTLVLATLNLQIDEERSEIESECADNYSEFMLKPSTNQNLASEDSSPTPSEDVPAPAVSAAFKSVSLEEENRILKEQRLCKVCMDEEVGVVFLPCGHFATCVNCAQNLQDCPVCRTAIKATVRTFLA